ncbi:MAG: hypothetical protein LM522_09565 [Candidatus Contendobacter sp.]|nr:hypothetical protein [Candidatus Contendobacter sp.]
MRAFVKRNSMKMQGIAPQSVIDGSLIYDEPEAVEKRILELLREVTE